MPKFTLVLRKLDFFSFLFFLLNFSSLSLTLSVSLFAGFSVPSILQKMGVSGWTKC